MNSTGRDRNFLRDLNIAQVAELLHLHQPVSRVELADMSGLGRSTITGITAQLIQQGLVTEVGEAESTGGRKPVLLEIAARSRLIACVRLAAQPVSLGLADLNGQLVARHRRALRDEREPDEVLGRVATWVTEMLGEFGPKANSVIGLSIALPGRVDFTTGTLLQAPTLGWRNVPVRQFLEEQLSIPVLVESSAGAFTRGEWLHGAGRKAQNVVGLTVGREVGGGIILDRELVRGVAGGAAGFSHIQIDPEGPPCWCGQRGCLETFVSDRALVEQALHGLDRGAESLLLEMVEGRRGAITREVIVAAAQDRDRLCLRLLEQAGRRIGTAVAAVANLLSPNAVILGGEAIEQAGPLLMDPIRETAAAQLMPWVAEQLRLEQALLGEAAWLTGAAGQVLDRVFRPSLTQSRDSYAGLHIAAWIPEET